MTSKINDQIKKRTVANDVFITPRDLALKQINLHDIKEEHVVLDPCCHSHINGSYFSQFPDCYREFCEVSNGYDKSFFDYHGRTDHIICNPPYSILDKWFKKCIEIRPTEISMLIGINNLTARRMKWMEEAGYGLSHMEMLKVFEWFGMSVIVKWTLNTKSIVTCDRKVYRKEEPMGLHEEPKKKYTFKVKK